ncbi:unnamed protein product [Owenia fusiformis]|uniref:SGNH hydrolase-type esterase domain-containing protein n=1 Tax=Owenia fusiformis TaxID=6347 RepID=A0A8J1UT39_OWEFU|nr:unnamed protein product [Owenia fusiformis]
MWSIIFELLLLTNILTSMHTTLKATQVSLDALQRTNDALQSTNTDLVKQLASKTADCIELNKENMQLRNRLLVADQPSTKQDARCQKSLLIGSSIVRDVDETRLLDTEVISISGGKIADANRTIAEKSGSYKSIILQVGSNDCAKCEDLDKIAEDYKMLVKGAKQRTNNVIISSITPRTDNDTAQATIDLINAGLVTIAEDENCTFVNNDLDFKLRDGTVNAGYLLPDGLHLSDAGTNRLGVNLKLNTNLKSVAKPRNRRRNKPKHNATNKCYSP